MCEVRVVGLFECKGVQLVKWMEWVASYRFDFAETRPPGGVEERRRVVGSICCKGQKRLMTAGRRKKKRRLDASQSAAFDFSGDGESRTRVQRKH